ncbi:MAG: hypothetical protein H0V49_08310 [Nocardioidaceae bacterium]|nr:hypothetical protein [Nocardioidaceae bacterium]
MSGAVPPPQPPSDPNQPPPYSGGTGPSDPGSYPDPNIPPSAPGEGTYVQPTPADGGYAQTSPPASSSTSMSGAQAKTALQSAHKFDLGIIACGLLAFLLSLFSGYYTYKVTVEGEDPLFGDMPGSSASFSAWHGFFGWFAALMALVAAILMILGLLGVIANRSAVRLGVLGAFALASLCVLLALLVVPGSDADQSFSGITVDVNPGHGITYWLSLLVILGGTALAFMRKDAKD